MNYGAEPYTQESQAGTNTEHGGTRISDGIIADILSRVRRVEERILKGPPQPPNEADTFPTIKGIAAEAVGTEPVVRYCNWEQFKNCFSEADVRSSIDVLALKDGDDLDEQMEEEHIKRLPPDTDAEKREAFEKQRLRASHGRNETGGDALRLERVRIKSPRILDFIARVTGNKSLFSDRPHTFMRPFRFLIHNYQYFEKEFRILEDKCRRPTETIPDRGQSIAHASSEVNEGDRTDNILLRDITLAEGQENVTGSTKPFGSGPTAKVDLGSTFAPPFGNQSQNRSVTGPSDSCINDTKSKTPEEFNYDHIRCFMEFASAQLVPLYRKFENLDHVGNPKIRYEDLWYLFRPGELVFEHEDPKQASESAIPAAPGDPATHRSNAQSHEGPVVWRVESVVPEESRWYVPSLSWIQDLRRRRVPPLSLEPLTIYVYRLEFDGEQYEPVSVHYSVNRREEMEITKLPVFPIRFHKDHANILEKYRKRGSDVQNLLMKGQLAVEYDGWTLSKDPEGDPIPREERPFYVSSNVIIDHKEALQSNPWWRPSFRSGKVGLESISYPLSTVYENFATLVWSDKNRTTLAGHMVEILVISDSVDDAEEEALARTDDFIVDPAARKIGKNGVDKALSPDDLALLPNRLFVYSLRDRKFVNANIQCLKEIAPMPDPWHELKIPDDHMDLIRSTVEDHFTKKRLERDLNVMGVESIGQDFIRSKGRGLVFLLHGPPGVGKTATAEAVAYAHKKPLFSLACFDLGVDAGTVESRLSEVFRLANLWDCVLLLDEADIFLSHREKKDDNLQRNAIVSIFLRTMEYYPGILFLTTNRPGALDEALNSRVHISLAFSDLGRRQTLDIFNMNIKRCRRIADQRATVPGEPELVIHRKEIEDFAAYEFDNSGPAPFWNGRVIRNAFQIAMSLAYVDRPRDSFEEAQRGDISVQSGTRHLGRDQFEKVLKIFNDFKSYRHVMFNKSDEKLAYERGER
ncbi:hypothetical protein V8F20_004729, partial [Naviculisporaceae sp. PSN 640]